jgi:uncharacterized protein (TIGR02453 family)
MKKVIEFLSLLDKNNDREWFAAHKKEFDTAKAELLVFIEQLLSEMKKIDPDLAELQASKTVYRIYRDVRFSKNKLPYKNNMGAYFSSGGKNGLKPGYYLHIQPGASFIGGGLYMPEAPSLNAIRQEIYFNYPSFYKIIQDKNFVKTFKELDDYRLKTFPKGFDKDHEAIELLKYKSFVASRALSEEEILSPDFAKTCLNSFKAMQPLVQWLNHALENAE